MATWRGGRHGERSKDSQRESLSDEEVISVQIFITRWLSEGLGKNDEGVESVHRWERKSGRKKVIFQGRFGNVVVCCVKTNGAVWG